MGYPSKDAAELTKKLLDLEDQSEYDDHEAGDVKKTKTTMRVAAADAAARPPRSCCGCCCKCLLITLIVLFLLGVAMVATLYHMTSKVVHDFTITEPHAKYPVVDMSEAEARLVGDRLNLFVDELLADNKEVPSEELVLTQDEINGVIGRDDYLRGNAMITLEKGIIREEVSLPVSMLPGGEGRYFVAHDYTKIDDEEAGGDFEVKLETEAKHEDWFDGPLYFARLQMLFSPEEQNMLELYLEKGSFFGSEVDQEFIDEHQNLMDYLYQDPSKKDLIKIMEGIEKISVLPGKLVITPRSA